jgi:hypothetical protein
MDGALGEIRTYLLRLSGIDRVLLQLSPRDKSRGRAKQAFELSQKLEGGCPRNQPKSLVVEFAVFATHRSTTDPEEGAKSMAGEHQRLDW